MKLALTVMILMGILGGTLNFLLATSETISGWRGWGKAVLLGIGAAILIPLFLNTISSNLLTEVLQATEPGSSTLVFAGFCLIAAITSRAFIQNLSDRILAEAREAKKAANEAREEVERVAEAVTDAVTEPATGPAGLGAEDTYERVAPAAAALSVEDRQFLQAMDSSRYTLRSASGIAQQLGKPITEVDPTLRRLEAGGLVSSRMQGKKGERWALTAWGRDALNAG